MKQARVPSLYLVIKTRKSVLYIPGLSLSLSAEIHLQVEMKRIVESYIRRQALCVPADKLLVALSGGADSVALLHVLLQLGFVCEAVHCNFHLRGDESNRDEEFVRLLCKEFHVKLHVTHFDTVRISEERHVSIEMAARDLRYTWFEEVRRASGAVYIAVAHHRDDSLETFLLNLLRGTGINGLLGIRPQNGCVIRPLLCVTRKEIIGYLDKHRLSYVTDSSNLATDYTRNKIRLRLLPLMEEINPSVREALQRTAENLSEAATIYNMSIAESRRSVMNGDGNIDIPQLLLQPSPEAVLHEVFYPLGFNDAQIQDILRAARSSKSGRSFTSPNWRVVKDRDRLLIAPCSENRPPQLSMQLVERTPQFRIPHPADGRHLRLTAWVDADKLVGELTLRPWHQGDRFVPFGMKCSKLVSDYLTDRKFSLIDKERQWVLCSGEEIVWLVGERADNRFRVDEMTKQVMIIKLVPEE